MIDMHDPYNEDKYREDAISDRISEEMDDDEEMLPCPCCGAEGQCIYNRERGRWIAQCLDPECGFDMSAETPGMAVFRWNGNR